MSMAGEQDIMKMIREKDTFAHKLGIEILEAAGGCSKVTMPLGADTANALGNVHGGAIFSLADMALATAANSEGVVSVAIEANIHYMAPCVSEGRLYAAARKIHETRRLGYFHVEIYQEEGKPIAVSQAMVYRKG
jgi:acyl-CoA thioesterase